jgi:uncharacterized metal-binding protein YceD (DUF177 family)
MAPEFSRPVEVARLGPGEAVYDLAADAPERAALARRFDLVSLDRLEAKVRLRRRAGGMVLLSARLEAELVQSDVVTLDPVRSAIADEFTLLYGEAKDDPRALDPDADASEPVVDGKIDLGEAVAQQLSLAIDPYPRAPAA